MTEEIIERLRSLDLSDGGSHLSAIASCFYQPTFGWTRGACEDLRDKLIEILEDKDGNDANDYAHDCSCTNHSCDKHGRQVSYDVLGNERCKAVCALRKVPDDIGKSELTYQEAEDMVYAALGVEKELIGYYKGLDALRDRLIHLLGCDECNFSGVESYMDATGEKSNPAETSDASTDHVSFDTRLKLKTYAYIILEFADTLGIDYPNGSKITDVAAEIRKRLSVLMSECKVMGFAKSAEIAKPESENGGEITITDELRKWIKSLYTPNSDKLKLEGLRIVDRIDTQFNRICEQNEAVLQQTIDTMVDERDKLQEKCDRLKAKAEHQREQLAVYATMCDFDAIRALKRERNEHKHRADNAEGHVKSLERRLDAAHETYCALLNDAAREFRALTEERDELRRSLRQIAERAGVPHDLDLSEYGDKKIANAVIGQLGETKRYVKALEWVRDRRLPKIEAKRDELQAKLDDYDRTHVELPKDENGEYIHIGDVMDGYGKTIEVVELRYERSGWVLISKDGNEYANTFAFEHHHDPTVEQVIRDLTLGKITESQAVERIEVINGQG